MRGKIRKNPIWAVTDSSSKPLSRELINVLEETTPVLQAVGPTDSTWGTQDKNVCFNLALILFASYFLVSTSLLQNTWREIAACPTPSTLQRLPPSSASPDDSCPVKKVRDVLANYALASHLYLHTPALCHLGWTVIFQELWMPLGWLPTAPSKKGGKAGKGAKGSGFREPLGSLRQQQHHHLELIRNAKPQDPPRTSWFRKSEVGASHLCCD